MSETKRYDADSREPGSDPFGRFLKLEDVKRSIGVSQAMIYKLMKRPEHPFPLPVKVGRVSLWVERDVIAWKSHIVETARGLE